MTLDAFTAASLDAGSSAAVTEVAERLAAGEPGTRAVLFYGSNLRGGTLDGVLDFYLLTGGAPERVLWPRVGYHEVSLADGRTARAKAAVVTLATFADAARGGRADTTVWARFVQPCRLVWAADAAAAGDARAAVRAAAVTAARFAAALGPAEGRADAFWSALFRETYRAEFRVERPGRADVVLSHAPDHYAALLPLAWKAGGVGFEAEAGVLAPRLSARERAALLRAWGRRRLAGRPLNVARLVRAAFTFRGAARYAAWKVERHTGVPVPLTPWMERHPILAAPGVLARVWRARG